VRKKIRMRERERCREFEILYTIRRLKQIWKQFIRILYIYWNGCWIQAKLYIMWRGTSNSKGPNAVPQAFSIPVGRICIAERWITVKGSHLRSMKIKSVCVSMFSLCGEMRPWTEKTMGSLRIVCVIFETSNRLPPDFKCSCTNLACSFVTLYSICPIFHLQFVDMIMSVFFQPIKHLYLSLRTSKKERLIDDIETCFWVC
jgi:hypothetical protein